MGESCGLLRRRPLRDEQQGRGGAGEHLHLLLVAAAHKADQQVVEDAHDAHQDQEEDDSLSKEEAWCAGGAGEG